MTETLLTVPANINFDLPDRGPTKEERLADYLSGPYSRQREEIERGFYLLRSNPSRRGVFELSTSALYFLVELGYWKKVATDLAESKIGDELRRARENAEIAQDSARSSSKRSVKEVEAEAKQHAGRYNNAKTLIVDTRSDMERIISWAQTALKELRDEEFSGEAAGFTGENPTFSELPTTL